MHFPRPRNILVLFIGLFTELGTVLINRFSLNNLLECIMGREETDEV